MADNASASRQRLTRGSTLGAGVLLVIALVGMVNYIGWKYHKRFDLTEVHLYSLSEKTLNVLKGLEQDVDVVVFMDPTDELATPVRELLSRYEAASSHLKVRVVDPAKNLVEARDLMQKLNLTRVNVVVFERGDDRRVVEATDLADYDYSGMQTGGAPELKGFKGEQQFTSAILELVEAKKPRIVFTSGHGEARIDDFSGRGLSSAKDLLGQDNFDLQTWTSLAQPAVPEGTDLVVIAGPSANFVAPEIDALRRYLAGGGRMLVMLDPTLAPAGSKLVDTGLEKLLADYGVRVDSDIVVDPGKAVPFFGAETFFVDTYQSHPITEALNQARYPVIFPLARSVAKGEAVAGLTVSPLLETSAEGWGETDLANLRAVAKDAADVAGPVSLGVAVTAESAAAAPDAAAEEAPDEKPAAGAEPDKGLRLVVLGDSDFATDSQISNAGNATLLANTINWLVERQALVAIPPKKPEQVRLNLTSGELSSVAWLVLALLPGLAVAAGVVTYLRRRR